MKKRFIVSMLMPAVASAILLTGCGSGTSSTPKAANEEITTVVESVKPKTTESSEKVSTSQTSNTSALDFYTAMQDNEMSKYTLNSAATEFIKSHPDLFPTGSTWSVSDDLIDYVSKSEHISKAPDKYGDKLIYIDDLNVIQIKEEIYQDMRFTWFNSVDSNGNFYTVLYRGELPDVIEGSIVNTYALPLGASSYDNTGGGQTLTIVLAACNVTLYQNSVSSTPLPSITNNTPQTIPQTAPAQDLTSEYVLPYSDSMYYTHSDVINLSPEQVRIAINEIYARHGRMFDSQDLQNYFNSKDWYYPTIPADQFDESILNDFEKKNIEVLKPLR